MILAWVYVMCASVIVFVNVFGVCCSVCCINVFMSMRMCLFCVMHHLPLFHTVIE